MPRFSKRYVAIVIAILALSGGAAFTLPYRSNPVDWTGRSKVSIVLTKKGFEPKSVYLTKGTEVTFSTTLNTPFWPASNIHPSHYIYPQFDPRAPISPDETWSFIFDIEGRWGYHDHLDATFSGFVVVLPAGATGKDGVSVLTTCNQDEKNVKVACWNENIRYVLESDGLDAAFDEIEKIYQSDSQFSVVCHVLTHDLGLRANDIYGDDVPFIKKTGYCNDGFWHGYMEGFFARHSNSADAYAFCDKVQESFKDTYPLAFAQCRHGIGHGGSEFLLRTRADLWGNIPELANLFISLCEPAEIDQRSCAYGAYSALQDWMQLQHQYDALLQPKAFLSLCSSATEVWAQEGCALEFSKRQRFDSDNLTAIFPLILKYGSVISNGSFIPSMVEGGAMSMGSRKQEETDDFIVAQCDSLSIQLRGSCLRGIVEGLFFSSPPNEVPKRVVEFCLSDVLARAEKISCASRLLRIVADSYISNKVGTTCNLFPSDIRNEEAVCTQGEGK